MASTINAKNTSTGVVITPDASGQLELQTADTTRMTITSGGDIGIGTSSPTSKLSINTSAGEISNLNSTNASGSYVSISNAGTNYGYIGDASQLIGGAPLSSLGIRSQNNLIFSSGGFAERMRIDSNGDVLIGTTTSNGRITAQFPGLTSIGMSFNDTSNSGTTQAIVFRRNTTSQVGSIQTSTTNTSYVTSSDYRLKDNVQPMIGALDKIVQLNPVTYTWKIDGSEGQGFIAHELQAVVPDCVTGEKDAVDDDGNPIYQGVDTSFLVATLTKAIQELKAELDTVKAELATLKGTA